jgi:hypothetical protein
LEVYGKLKLRIPAGAFGHEAWLVMEE